jgi:hypothetical protein
MNLWTNQYRAGLRTGRQGNVDELVSRICANIHQFRSAEQELSLQIVNRRQFDRLVSLISATDGTVVTGEGLGQFDAAHRTDGDHRPVAYRWRDGR